MLRVWAGLAAVAAALFATSAAAAPLAAYGELPTIEQIAISPDGKLLAIDVVKGEQRSIVVQDLAARKILTGIRTGEAKIRNLQFAGNDHLIITSSSTSGMLGVMVDKSEWFVASDFNLTTHRVTPLLGDVEMAGNSSRSDPEVRIVDGKPTLFVTGVRFVGEEGDTTLFRIDLDGDRSRPVLDTGGEMSTEYMVGADGKPSARVRYDAPSKQWMLDVWQQGTWRPAQARKAFIETPDLQGLGRDGHSILIGEMDDGRYTVRELSADGATLSEPLPWGAYAAPIHDPATHQLIGVVAQEEDGSHYRFFDQHDEMDWQAIQAAFPDGSVALASWSDDRQRVVVQYDSPTDGARLRPGRSRRTFDAAARRPVPGALERRHFAGQARHVQGRGRTRDRRISDPAPRRRRQEAAAGGLSTRRSRRARRAGVRLVGAGDGLARLRGAAGELPRLGRLRLEVHVRRVRRVGRQDADRPLRRRPLSGGARHDRSGQGVHRRRQLWRLCGAGRRDHRHRRLPLRGRRLRPVGPGQADQLGQPAGRPAGRWRRALLGSLHGRERPRRSAPGRHFARRPRRQGLDSDPDHPRQGRHGGAVRAEPDDGRCADEGRQALRLRGAEHEDHWLSRSDTRLQMLQAMADFLAKNNPAD